VERYAVEDQYTQRPRYGISNSEESDADNESADEFDDLLYVSAPSVADLLEFRHGRLCRSFAFSLYQLWAR